MTRKEIEELVDDDIVELYKAIDNFINFLDKELVGDDNAK
jgi:hypothetical protein